jgi:hypothetical protein
MAIPKCVKCRCPGNMECTYPPTGEDAHYQDCSLSIDTWMCPCCRIGVDRMSYKPELDGQESLL